MYELIRLKYHFTHKITDFFFRRINVYICMFALSTILPAGQAYGQELRFDKDEYFAGDTITVLYPDIIDPKTANDPRPDFLYSVMAKIICLNSSYGFPDNPSSEEDKRIFDNLSRGNNRYRNPSTEKIVVGGISQYRNVPGCDATFQLYHRDTGPIGKIYHFRIHPYVRTVNSALKVTVGQNCGDPATFMVMPPALDEFTFFKVKKKPRWTLKLFQLGSPFLGGRQIPDRELENWIIKEGKPQTIVWEGNRQLILPTCFELRLGVDIKTEYWDEMYVIARKQFTQKPKPDPMSFGLKDITVPKIGERFAFRYYGKDRESVGVCLAHLGPDGRLIQSLRKPILKKTGETYKNIIVSKPGTYIARLQKGLRQNVHWDLTMDNLRFDVSPKRDPDYPQFLRTNNDQLTFFEGDDIPVFVHAKDLFKNLKNKVGGYNIDRIDDLSVSLYPEKPATTKEVKPPDPKEMAQVESILKELGKVQQDLSEAMTKGNKKAVEKYSKKMTKLYEKMNKASGSPPPVSSGPIKTWPVKLGKNGTLLIKGEFPPGEYLLRLQGIVGKRLTTLFQKYIAILPRLEKNPIDLGGRERFEVGEIIEVSLPLLPEQFNYEFHFAGEGGFLPGCVYTRPPIPRHVDIGNERTVKLHAPNIPGIYFLRLCTIRHGTRVIGEVRIEVIASPDPEGTIVLDKLVYKPQEDMQVTINPDAAIYYPNRKPQNETQPDFRWQIMSMGHAVSGGAVNPISVDQWCNYITDIHMEKTATIKAPSTPGVYAIALYAPSIWGFSSPLTLKYFHIAISGNPPIEHGPYGTRPPSPLPDPDYPFPPWGEYLENGYCEDFDLEEKPEEMELRFVYWSEGKYLPVEGDLKFGQFFYIEGKLKEAAEKQAYFVQMDIPNGDGKEVMLSVSNEDEKLVRSEMLYFIWDGLEPGGAYESN